MHFGLEEVAPTLLYASAILAFLLAVFWRPHVGLYYIVPLLPLQTLRYRLHPYPLGGLLVDVMLLGVVLGLWRQGRPVFPRTPFRTLIVVFAVLTYLSLWRGSLFLGGSLPLWFDDLRLQDWKNYMVMPLMLGIVSSAIRDTRRARILILLMCCSALLLDKYFLGTIKDRDFSQFSHELRDAGAIGYAGENGLAAFEAQFAIFLLGFSAGERKTLIKLGYLAMVVLCSVCLMYTFSRGGYAAFLAGLLFLGAVKQRKLLVLLVIVLLTWQGLVPNAVRERVFMTQQPGGQVDSSAGERLALWEDALELFRSNPVFGTGFNSYAYMSRVGLYSDTHNLYLKVLVEMGVVGLGLFLFFLWRMFSAGYALFRSSENPFLSSLGLGFAGLMVCVFVGNLFGDRWTFLQVSGFTWVLLGLVCRGTELNEQPEASEECGEPAALATA